MIYRVRMKMGWDKFRFDFDDNVVTAGRVSDTALEFMKLAADSFVNEEEDRKDKEFKCWLEAIPEEKDRKDDF